MIQTIFLLICILVLLLIFLKNGSLLFVFFLKKKSLDYEAICLMTGVYVCSRVQLFAMPCTVAHQALLSMGFPREEHWSG